MSIFPSTFCIIFLVLLHSPQTLSHTKGIRPGTQLIPFNRTRTELAEQQFMKWVRFVGTLKHSIFSTAKNKVSPSYTLVVDKNPSLGDFTTIQDAIDSLPSVNLVRVIIRVNAGIYKWVSNSYFCEDTFQDWFFFCLSVCLSGLHLKYPTFMKIIAFLDILCKSMRLKLGLVGNSGILWRMHFSFYFILFVYLLLLLCISTLSDIFYGNWGFPLV